MSEPTLGKRRVFRREFKLQVLREVAAGKSQAQAAREYQLSESTIHKWQEQLSKYKDKAFAGAGRPYTDEARVHELERVVGRLAIENDFLKKLLQKLENDS
jgi:transposase-like protein